jgi:hypothetical protein
MTSVIFRAVDNLMSASRQLWGWVRDCARHWPHVKPDRVRHLWAQMTPVIFRAVDNLMSASRRLWGWARDCARHWPHVKPDRVRHLWAQMTAFILDEADYLVTVSRLSVWIGDRARWRQIQSVNLPRIVGAAIVAIVAGSMTYRGIVEKAPSAVPRQVPNNALRGDKLAGALALSGRSIALVAQEPPPAQPVLPPTQRPPSPPQPALAATQESPSPQPAPAVTQDPPSPAQLAMALPQAALPLAATQPAQPVLPLSQSLPEQAPKAAAAALELAKLEERPAPSEDLSPPATPVKRDLAYYLRLYPYAEYPMPDKPADIVLATMKDIPLGTPIEEIKRASDAFGLDFSFMKAVARIESDFDPRQRTGSYIGLFQLSRYEFRKYGSGDIFNARDNAIAAAYKFVTEETLFEWYTGKKPTFSDLYLIHQQGWQGAAEHVSHPERTAWKSMCATDEGMEKGEKWCKRAVWGNTLPSIKQDWKSVDNLTSGAFVDMWRERIEHLYARYAEAAAEGREIPVKQAEEPKRKRPTVHAKVRAKARHLARAAVGARKVAALERKHPEAEHAKIKHADSKHAVKRPEHHRRAAAPPPSHRAVPVKKQA